MYLMNGVLEYRCRLTPEPPENPSDPWLIDDNIKTLCGSYSCPEKFFFFFFFDKNNII